MCDCLCSCILHNEGFWLVLSYALSFFGRVAFVSITFEFHLIGGFGMLADIKQFIKNNDAQLIIDNHNLNTTLRYRSWLFYFHFVK